jgi:16S rRNA processing protein RimM
MVDDTDLIRVGHFGAPHALAGALRLRTIDDPQALLGLKRVHVPSRGWLQVKAWEQHNAGLVVRLLGVTSKEAAEKLRNLEVFAVRTEVRLESGRFYYHDLIGLPVRDPVGLELGVVEDVLDAGPQDLLSVLRFGRSFLVPLQAPYVQVLADCVVIDPIPGLLESDG